MAMLILVTCGAVFLFGLVQWARSGAVLWDIFRLAENSRDPKARQDAAERMKSMESMMERLLRSSFRVLGTLAVMVWLFVVVIVIVDALGLGWLDGMSFQANRLFGNPSVRAAGSRPPSGRGGTLQLLGSGLTGK
jgi:type IV secretory pathway VirB2 component (pilin)